MPVTTLEPAAGYVVLINTFTVEPDKADELMSVLSALGSKHTSRERDAFP